MHNRDSNNTNSKKKNFRVLKTLYMEGGESPHPPPVCSIHLDDIAPERPPHAS